MINRAKIRVLGVELRIRNEDFLTSLMIRQPACATYSHAKAQRRQVVGLFYL